MSRSRNKPQSNLLANSTEIFLTHFSRKSQIVMATSLTDLILTYQGFNKAEIDQAKDLVYLAMISVQGSLKTNGPGFGTTFLLKNLGYSEDDAYWPGFAVGVFVSLTLDFTPWGITKTALSTVGGIAGKWCTTWAYDKARTYISGSSSANVSTPRSAL